MWKGFDYDVKRTTHMFEGIFIDSFDNDNPSDHPLNFASGVLTTSAIKGSLQKALDKGINIMKKHLIPSKNSMPLKSFNDPLPKSNDRNTKDSPYPIQQCNNQLRNNVFEAFCNKLLLNKSLFLLICSRMTDQ